MASFVEAAKARWNAEVVSLARWVQAREWAAGAAGEQGDGGEGGVARALGADLSRAAAEVMHSATAAGPEPAGSVPAGVGEALREARDALAGEVKAVVSRGVEEAGEAATKAAEETKAAVAKGVEETKTAVSRGVEETKGVVSKGVEKARDLAERAKAAVYLAEQKAETRADAKLLHVSDIERALQERYDSAAREERMKRSVEEVLRERYTPIGERDNSRLRGL